MLADLERSESKRIRQEMAEKAQQIAEHEAVGDLGGDNKMSGWPAAALTTKIKHSGDTTFLTPAGKLAAAGWTTATLGRHADGGVGRFQGPGVNMRTGNTRRLRNGLVSTANRRRTGVRWNGVTRGKGTADKAFNVMATELPPIAERGVKRAIARRFDVT